MKLAPSRRRVVDLNFMINEVGSGVGVGSWAVAGFRVARRMGS
jgi:hypothetical protein